ncbi:MAG: hypothetical protein HY231_20895 [Acidobacteria bacterium]|nr:hypothetical protein [Acidobacteriota bacterium]
MEKHQRNRYPISFALAIAALILFAGFRPLLNSQAASRPPSDANLISELQALDRLVNELSLFDKKVAELNKQSSLTRAEFETHQRLANSLKNRLSAMQSTLREIIRKLKATGQFDNLDAIVLAKISDAKFQSRVRRDGFKKVLEETAANLSGNANEISAPLDLLRNRIRAQAQDSLFEPNHSLLASRAVAVAYRPTPVVFTFNLRCSLAYIRGGISGAFHPGSGPSDKSILAVNCFCDADGAACSQLFAE